jgi:hypothetical protein
MQSLNFETDRILEYKESIWWTWNLVSFYRFCRKDEPSFIKEEIKSLEDSERKIEKSKKEFEEFLINYK